MSASIKQIVNGRFIPSAGYQPTTIGQTLKDHDAAITALQGASTRGMVLICNGQSNAVRRAPRVSFAYPPKLRTFAGANESADRVDGIAEEAALDGAVFDATAPYSEFGKNEEGYAPGFAAANVAHGSIITHSPARGGYHYRQLMSGMGPWADLTTAIRRAYDLLAASGAQGVDLVMVWDHGEADADAIAPGGGAEGTVITKAQYVEVLADLVNKTFFTAKNAAMLPNLSPLVLGVQICTVNGDGWRAVQNAHLEAAKTLPGYFLAGPKYAYEHESDGVHITGKGKRLFGEYLAHRAQDIALGGALLPVHILSATRAGAVITATYQTIAGALVIDADTVPDTVTAYPGSKYGFEYFYGGAAISVNSVTVAGNVATITLASVPAGAGELRYAQMTWPGGLSSVSGPTSRLARGCIRDSGQRTAKFDGRPLFNHACHQSIATN